MPRRGDCNREPRKLSASRDSETLTARPRRSAKWRKSTGSTAMPSRSSNARRTSCPPRDSRRRCRNVVHRRSEAVMWDNRWENADLFFDYSPLIDCVLTVFISGICTKGGGHWWWCCCCSCVEICSGCSRTIGHCCCTLGSTGRLVSSNVSSGDFTQSTLSATKDQKDIFI